MKNRKSIPLLLLLSVLPLVALPVFVAPASADSLCPSGYTLALASRFDGVGTVADTNGDGLVCYAYVTYALPDGTQIADGVFCLQGSPSGCTITTLDIIDTVASPIGSCPTGFTYNLPEKSMTGSTHPADRNGDGVICSKITNSGITVNIDDNVQAK